MDYRVIRTNSDNADFQKLILDLEVYLTGLDEAAHSECKEYNKLDSVKHVVAAYSNNEVVGCGAIRAYDTETIEIKRMFISENYRNKGVATRVLCELEIWAKELGFAKSILETGTMMDDAIKFYKKNKYTQISNYGSYVSKSKSICFSKNL